MNMGISYELFYEVLSELRNEFHKNGRFDDSNTKLDEITKLLFMNFSEAKNGTNRFNLEYLRKSAEEKFNDNNLIAKALRELFQEILDNPLFETQDGSSIFGANSKLNIQDSDNILAEKIVLEIGKLDFQHLVEQGTYMEFDIINECFGHFVRDNFRNNIEDAQYMTPQEIVKPLLDIVFSDILNESFLEKLIEEDGSFTVMDPTCGVGTLLIEPVKYILDYVNKSNIPLEKKEYISNKILNNGVIGQDKVDRMVRLSKLNSLFMGANPKNIFAGNSILNGSTLDEYANKVDLIVTNPPFGADYEFGDFYKDKRYKIINSARFRGMTIPSELILLDRCLTMLKADGKLMIVVPDSVVSSNSGVYKVFREELLKVCNLKGIVELPAVTFAQAGTRTKTCVIYLEKKESVVNEKIFMSTCESIGFEVKSRKGAPMKVKKGDNQMPLIAEHYAATQKILEGEDKQEYILVNGNPSFTYIKKSFLENGNLTPNFYSYNKLKILAEFSQINLADIEIKKLEDVAYFSTKERASYSVDENIKHISVLHIRGDGTIDFEEVEDFLPIGKGRECRAGDIIFSKINPRIYRLAVVPPYHNKLVCSNEFEILTPLNPEDTYLIYSLLKIEPVVHQVNASTSGTSSSHNRVKTQELRKISLPYPKGKVIDSFRKNSTVVEAMFNQKYEAQRKLLESQSNLVKMIGMS